MKANHIRKALDFLGFKGLGDIDFDFATSYHGVSVAVSFSSLSHDELVKLKRVFGPLKAEVSQYASALTGSRNIHEDFEVDLRISSAFECKELAPEDMTDEKLDTLRANIMAGTVKVQDCTPKVLEV